MKSTFQEGTLKRNGRATSENLQSNKHSYNIQDYSLWGITLVTVIILGLFLFKYTMNVPYWDDYGFLHFINDFYDNPTFKRFVNVLFRQHNEHRIVIPKLIAFLDHIFFGDINFRRLILYANLFLLAVLTMLHGLYKDRLLLTIAALAILIPRIELNFWALGGLQNIGVFVFAFASIFFLYQERSNKNLLYACLLAILSILTSASGVLTFISGAIFILLQERRILNSRFLIWSLVSILSIGFYLFTYESPTGHPDMITKTFRDLLQLPAHSLLLTTSVFSDLIPNLWFRFILGAAIHLSWLWLVTKNWDKILQFRLHTSLFIFMLLNSWLVSISRYGFGAGQANSERYEIISALLIITSIALLFKVFDLKTKWKWLLLSVFLVNYITTIFKHSDNSYYYKTKLMASALGYNGKIGKLIQFPSEGAAINWLDQSIERGLYENISGNELELSRDSTSSPLESRGGVAQAWGIEINTDNKIYISGWAAVKGESSKLFDISLVMSDKRKSYVYSTIPFIRDDVTRAINDGVDYDESGFGFYSLKSKLGIPNGNYQLGILLTGKRSGDRFFSISEKHLDIKQANTSLRIIDLTGLKEGAITSGFGHKGDEIIVVDGWAFLNSEPSLQAERQVLLRLEGSSTAYAFTPDVVFRDDVTRHFNDGNNYNFSGFEFSFSPFTVGIPSGKYELGVRLTSTTQDAVQFIDQYLIIP